MEERLVHTHSHVKPDLKAFLKQVAQFVPQAEVQVTCRATCQREGLLCICPLAKDTGEILPDVARMLEAPLSVDEPESHQPACALAGVLGMVDVSPTSQP